MPPLPVENGFYVANFDGSATPNPGNMNIGGIIKDDLGKVVAQFSENVGEGTNNLAEALALKKVCEILVYLRASKAQIIGDSELIVKQINGEYKIRNQNLKVIAKDIKSLLKNIEYNLSWVPRNKNKEADTLSKG